MTYGLPPIPVYPTGLDTDRTLYHVYNTAEAELAADNPAFADQVDVAPRTSPQPEVWADNGLATIAGELFYYDGVDKDGSGYVVRLKRCVRNLGGNRSQFNPKGAWVRGFVCAEHHNQLADAVAATEGFVGENFSEDEGTLDWRIRNLEAAGAIFDDHDCPSVEFDFVVVSSSRTAGTLVSYRVAVVGAYTKFVLSFGDGTSVTSAVSGQKVYAPNATIDPILTVASDGCEVVMSPKTRDRLDTPTGSVLPPPFTVPTPILPGMPTVVVPPLVIPSLTFNMPPIMQPCVEGGGTIGGLSDITLTVNPPINLPSVISLTAVDIPSFISVTSVNLSNISLMVPSIIPLDLSVTIPSTITFGPVAIPSAINFGPISVPSAINFGPVTIPDTINFGAISLPSLISIVNTVPAYISLTHTLPLSIAFVDVDGSISLFRAAVAQMPAAISLTGSIPSSIALLVPAIPDIGVDYGTPPTLGVNYGAPPPLNISLVAPSTITVNSNIPSTITLNGSNIPSMITLDGSGIPSSITIDGSGIPSLTVDWGTPPVISATCTIQCPTPTGMREAAASRFAPEPIDFGVRDPGFGGQGLEVQYEMVGFPSEIKIAPPVIDPIRVEHDLPSALRVEAPSFADIRIVGPAPGVLPAEIRIIPPDRDLAVSLVGLNLPSQIGVVVDDEAVRRLAVSVVVPDRMPSVFLDASGVPDTIRVVGMPDTISVVGEIPVFVPPDVSIPVVYDGPPIPVAPVSVHFTFGFDKFLGDSDDGMPCFRMVPCSPKV